MPSRDYARLAELTDQLDDARIVVQRCKDALESARSERDALVLEAIKSGMPWREVADRSGMSVSNIGYARKRSTSGIATP